MKTQIKELRSGTKVQVTNPAIDYSELPAATSHTGHSGSNNENVSAVWQKVIAENPQKMKISIKGLTIDLTANWSTSGKSVSYRGSLSKSDLEHHFALKAANNEEPTISIQSGNIIVVSNGKKANTYVCPSLVEIL